MKSGASQAILLAMLFAGLAPAIARGADEIKSGKWQFTTQMQMPGIAQSPPGSQPTSAGSPDMTRVACITPANPIPAEAQCTTDSVNHNGATVTWTMTCNSPRGPVRSAGSGRYAGDTMEATLTARVPGPNGQPVDAPGRITGRYLGPCDAR